MGGCISAGHTGCMGLAHMWGVHLTHVAEGPQVPCSRGLDATGPWGPAEGVEAGPCTQRGRTGEVQMGDAVCMGSRPLSRPSPYSVLPSRTFFRCLMGTWEAHREALTSLPSQAVESIHLPLQYTVMAGIRHSAGMPYFRILSWLWGAHGPSSRVSSRSTGSRWPTEHASFYSLKCLLFDGVYGTEALVIRLPLPCST